MQRTISSPAEHSEQHIRLAQLDEDAASIRGDQDHRALLDAFSARDDDKAKQVIARHLTRTALTVMADIAPEREPITARTALLPPVATGCAADTLPKGVEKSVLFGMVTALPRSVTRRSREVAGDDQKGHLMSLFDMIKDKAAELLGGASEKVSDLTGVDLPVSEAVDGVAQSAAEVTESGQNIVDTASAQGMDVLGATDTIDPNPR
ncbi:hypothetical protein [Amycolatopsis sp. RTGN1]|uniref:hypothetical protein n=1 Tax=Amycolatopsis ponsaeliensis TaxID=2992142 RepID=UPI00255126C6|nr:hypothetical protein [Amycolatopsis sp. RTGN1]